MNSPDSGRLNDALSANLQAIRSWWGGGLEMFVGAIEGAVAYVIGIGISHIS
jgi:hypothetical protein